jgi:hypothetical protein
LDTVLPDQSFLLVPVAAIIRWTGKDELQIKEKYVKVFFILFLF